jgi:hypothetical protein
MTHRLDLRFRQTIKGSRHLDLEDHIVVKNTTVPTPSVDRGGPCTFISHYTFATCETLCLCPLA